MSQTRVGIIGAGAFTEVCLTAYRQYRSDLTVVAITDLKSSRAKKVAQQFGIKTVSQSPAELLALDSIELVVILTPPNSHFELARAALTAGKNVLVEKPIAFSAAEAKTLIDLAERQGKSLAANFILRYHPFHQQIRETVAAGQLGRLTTITTTAAMARYPDDHWYWDKKISGGFFLNTYCHFIDLYNYIVGEKPVDFHCRQQSRLADLIELDFPTAKATLSTNLDVSNEEELVETRYVFERGTMTTFGWLPERMIITDNRGSEELHDELGKESRYRQLLAAVLADLIARSANPTVVSRVNHDALFESVRQPLLAEASQKS